MQQNKFVYKEKKEIKMKANVIDIYCFTGTGNTLLVAKEFAKELERLGKKVNFFRMEKSDPKSININHCLGIAFPVAVFTTFPLVWEFVKNLPRGNACEVFMLDTLGGFSGGLVGPMKKALLKNSYLPIGAVEIKMPDNLLQVKDHEKNKSKITIALMKAREYAQKLVAGKTRWHRLPLLGDIMSLLGRSKYPWRFMGKKIRIEQDNCIKCGLCAKLCPVNNIEMQDVAIKHNQCQVCLRCISFCPHNAINFNGKVRERYRAIEANELS